MVNEPTDEPDKEDYDVLIELLSRTDGERGVKVIIPSELTRRTRIDGEFLVEGHSTEGLGHGTPSSTDRGPRGTWDAVILALPLLLDEHPELRHLANSFEWVSRS